MSLFPRKDNHSGVWKLNDISEYLNDGSWPDAAGRGICMAGRTPSETDVIEFVTIASAGNATDFGDLQSTKYNMGTASNGTRAFSLGGYDNYPSQSNVIDYMVINSAGQSSDFGNLVSGKGSTTGASNRTRALALGAGDSSVGHSATIDFIEMASLGNALDFGDLTQARGQNASVNNSTTALAGGGIIATNNVQNTIDKAIISTTGNATDFGDLSTAVTYTAGCSNSSRGLFGGGNTGPADIKTIELVTINTEGNSVEFGDLTANANRHSSTSNSKRGLFFNPTTGNNDNIDQLEISSAGNTTDFGDMTVARSNHRATSDSHGGLTQGTDRTELLFGIHALFSSAYNSGSSDDTHALNMQTKGNSTFFGDLASAIYSHGGASNRHQAIMAGGSGGSNVIQKSIFATTGAFRDFGDLTQGRHNFNGGQAGSQTRGLFGGGYIKVPGNATTDTIDFITFSSSGGASDFGNLTAARRMAGSASSPTRAVFQAGITGTGTSGITNIIDFVTIASTGNATDFGDTTISKRDHSSGASAVRALTAGSTGNSNVIDFITIASTGDSTDFGDLTVGRSSTTGASNSVRFVAYAGTSPGANVTIDEVTIATTGNAVDFGDAERGGERPGGAASGHGGLN